MFLKMHISSKPYQLLSGLLLTTIFSGFAMYAQLDAPRKLWLPACFVRIQKTENHHGQKLACTVVARELLIPCKPAVQAIRNGKRPLTALQ